MEWSMEKDLELEKFDYCVVDRNASAFSRKHSIYYKLVFSNVNLNTHALIVAHF